MLARSSARWVVRNVCHRRDLDSCEAPRLGSSSYSTRLAMDYSLALTDIADDAVHQAILTPLRAYNASKAGASKKLPLVVTVLDTAGSVVGGLWGSTSYEWLFTELLVVPETLRGRGIGRQLMTMAHEEAVARGCRGAWLDTFEFQARGFYEGLGYRVFGEIPQYPPGHSRFFLSKDFAFPVAEEAATESFGL